MNKYTEPLHKTTHFRRLREVIKELAKKAKIDITKYNLENIRCYRSVGTSLMGRNVHTLKAQRDRCCFVWDNDYEIYECPCKTNKLQDVGEFLMIAHNTDFDYWMVVILYYNLKTKQNKSYVNVTYDPKYIGYVMYKSKDHIIIQDFKHPHALELGLNLTEYYFDHCMFRAGAYNTTPQQHSIKNTKNENYKLETANKVIIFKKKNEIKRSYNYGK